MLKEVTKILKSKLGKITLCESPQSLSNTHFNLNFKIGWAILIFSLAACWINCFGEYILRSDDIPKINRILESGLLSWMKEYILEFKMRRWFWSFVFAPYVYMPKYLTGVYLVLLWTICTSMIYYLMYDWTRSVRVSLLAAVFYGVIPIAHDAALWLTGSYGII